MKTLPASDTVSRAIRFAWGLRRHITLKRLPTIVLLLLGFVVIWNVYRSPNIVVEPFTVPPMMAEMGYTSEVVARQLVGAVNDINQRLNGNLEIELGIDDEPVELEVPHLGISLQSVIDHVNRLRKRQVIRGEFVYADAQSREVSMHLRINGIPIGDIVPKPDTQVTDLIAAAARRVMMSLAPLILASYYYVQESPESWTEVRELIEFMLANAPDAYHESRTINMRGSLRMEYENNIDSAIRDFKRAIDVDPKFAAPYNNWGVALSRSGRYQRAIGKYEMAIEHDAEFAVAYNNWGRALRELGHDDEAITQYQKAIQLDPFSSGPHSNWGVILLERGDTKGAISKFEKAVEYNPEFAIAYDNWGQALRQQRLCAAADMKHQRAIEIDPDMAIAYFNRGILMQMMGGLPNEAIRMFQKAIEINPDDAMAHVHWGAVLARQGKFEAAIAKHQAALRIQADNAQAYNSWGVALLHLEQIDEAIGKFERAVELDPGLRVAYQNWATALEQKGMREAAREKRSRAPGLEEATEDPCI